MKREKIPVRFFVIAAAADAAHQAVLEKHLSPLWQQGLLEHWQSMRPGEQLEEAFVEAKVILLLLSADFYTDTLCQDQMQQALELQKKGDVQIIPILLRAVEMTNAPFAHLAMVPTNGDPVTLWTNQDAAWTHIAETIRCVLEGKLLPQVREAKQAANNYDTSHNVFASNIPTIQIVEKEFNADVSPEAEQIERKRIRYKEQWNSLSPGMLLLRYTGHSGPVLSVAWSPDGKRIASGSKDGTVQVWSPDDEEPPFTFNVSDQVPWLVWSPDGRCIASLSKNGRVQGWNANTRERSFTFTTAGPIVWSPDGKRIASLSRNGTVQVWNAAGSGQLFIYKSHFTLLDFRGSVLSVAWSPDSTRAASAYKDGTVQVWNADGSGQPFIYKGHFSLLASFHLGSLMWSPNGKRIASAFIDRTVQVWNADGSGQPFVYKGHCDFVTSVAWSPNGKRIASLSRDGTVQVWNADGSGQPFIYNASGSIAWSPDGKHIASLSRNGLVQVWNSDDSGQSFIYNASGPIAWSPDGKRIASGSSDLTVQIWSAR